jgi:hypothetical protein
LDDDSYVEIDVDVGVDENTWVVSVCHGRDVWETCWRLAEEEKTASLNLTFVRQVPDT